MIDNLKSTEMKKIIYLKLFYLLLFIVIGHFSCHGQSNTAKSDFMSRVRFGGELGVQFGNNITQVTVAPSAIYAFNQYVSAGAGLRVGYLQERNFYDAWIYGGSLIALFNPIREIQLSAELEQLRYNFDYDSPTFVDEDFWNTGLYLGAGYNSGNVVIGIRYNVLFDNDKFNSEPWFPFVRVYF